MRCASVYFTKCKMLLDKMRAIWTIGHRMFCFGNVTFIWSHLICLSFIFVLGGFLSLEKDQLTNVVYVQGICQFHARELICIPLLHSFRSPTKVRCTFITVYVFIELFQSDAPLQMLFFFLSILQGSPTNNVSPTSTPAKSVPTLQPPPGEVAAAATAAPAEPAEEWV